MKFSSFRIQNYKGIRDATITLSGGKGSIYTLVGLNESGKTTILEAINNFRHDVDGIHVIAQRNIATDPIEALVPKRVKDNFNGNISITARVHIEDDEIARLASICRQSHAFQLDTQNFPTEFSVSRVHRFENSEHMKTSTLWALDPRIKKKRGRKFARVGSTSPEWQAIVREIGSLFPRIIYFPTFLFEFPEKIMVSNGKASFEGNEYFKKMVEDALANLEDPLDLQTHIVDRVLKKDTDDPFMIWLPRWMLSDERERVSSALAKLSQKITREVFGRWKDVLGTDVGQKELTIEHLVEEGDANNRNVYLTFAVKDGFSSFKVSERSLGFRWFFCFLLFTRFFRGNETGGSIFLFDEPASNLHSKAQAKLLDSFRVIAGESNDIIYSTHSHHLINPLWLETAFIITNGQPDDGNSIDTDFVVDHADIHAQRYKTFVGQNAERSHYFQPILDRLQVSPSLLEATREGVFVEGKSDFYILNWYKKYHDKTCLLDYVPVGGATNGAALMSLYLGLANKFIFLLDSDAEGRKARDRYLRQLPIGESNIVNIGEAFPNKSAIKRIEDLISDKTKIFIGQKYGVSRVSKSHILRAYSEALSGNNDLPNDSDTLRNIKTLADWLTKRLRNL